MVANDFSGILFQINFQTFYESKLNEHDIVPAEILAKPRDKQVYVLYHEAIRVHHSFNSEADTMPYLYDEIFPMEGEEGFYDWDETDIWKPWDGEYAQKKMRIII